MARQGFFDKGPGVPPLVKAGIFEKKLDMGKKEMQTYTYRFKFLIIILNA
jgi:hypothetical protein